MHTQHMEVFSLNQVHMAALLCTSTWHVQSWGRQEARSPHPEIYKYIYIYFKRPVSDGGKATVLAEEPVHAWRQLHQMVLLSSPPSWNEITEIFMPPVRSPAISLAVQHAPSSSLHTLIFIMSFSCSSASLMIRISRSLISRHKKRLSLCSICARHWLWNVFVHHCRNN